MGSRLMEQLHCYNMYVDKSDETQVKKHISNYQ